MARIINIFNFDSATQEVSYQGYWRGNT